MTPNMTTFNGPFSGRVDGLETQSTSQFSISPIIVKSRVENDVYYFTFQNMCYNGMPTVGQLKVNQNALKDKLNTWIKPQDKKYIKLVDYNTQTSKFAFDIDAWLDDGLKNCRPERLSLGMSKSFRLSVKLPYMVSVYGLEMEFGKYIEEHFKRALRKNKMLRNTVFGALEHIVNKTLSKDSVSMFDYSYNRMNNAVNVSVKPIYLATLTLVTTKFIKDDKLKKEIDFDKTVGMFLKLKP